MRFQTTRHTTDPTPAAWLILTVFLSGEKFSSDECRRTARTTCDNCIHRGKFQSKDMSTQARTAINLVQSARSRVTIIMLADALRGSESKKTQSTGLVRCQGFGSLKTSNRSEVERLLRRLVSESYLKESIVVGQHGMVISYVDVGKKQFGFNQKFVMDVELHKKKDVTSNDGATSSGQNSNVDKVVACCYEALLTCRKGIADTKQVAVHNILPNDTLHELSEVRPHTKSQLLQITGFTRLKVDFYGADFLKVLKNFPGGKARNDTSSSTNGKWINTAVANSNKPAGGKANFDKYKYGKGKQATGRKSAAAPPPPPKQNTLNLMPMPLPKIPKKPARRL